MATLTVTQPTGEGISLKFVHAPIGGGADAVTGTVFLATTSIDNQEFIYKDFVYTNNEATVILSNSDLVRVYTQSNVDSGDYATDLTMSATSVDTASVTLTQTTISGLVTEKQLTYQAVPTTPTVTALQGQDGYISFSFTTTSVEALTLSNGNASCDIIVNSTTDGIQTFTVESISFSTDGSTHTVVAQTPVGSLTNATNYEAAIRVSNINGKSLFSDTQSIVPSNIPNSLINTSANTFYSSGTTLQQTEGGIAVVFGAEWLDSDADKGSSVIVRFGVVDENNYFHENTSIQQGTVSLTASYFISTATAIPNCNVRNSWFGAAYNDGTDVTQLEIVARIEQTTDGIVNYSNLTTPLTVYKITLPTLSAITIESVDAAGLQTFNTATGGTLVDDINTGGTLTATYNSADSNIAITTTGNSATLMDADFTLDYATIDAGSNGTLTFTLSLPDANGTQSLGSLVQYTVTKTQSLHAFKDPLAPTPSITGGAVTIAPTIAVTVEGDNFGYTLDNYDAVVYDDVEPIGYQPFVATVDGSSRQADSTGTAYRVADYRVAYTKNLSGIPSDYAGKYTTPIVTGTSAGTALYFINPTITNVTVSGADMVISGNTGGATFATGAITSLGFTAGSSADDFDISTETANMPATGSGNLAAYAFTVTVTHAQGALVLDRNNAATGGQFDGFGFVNASNANSALSILN